MYPGFWDLTIHRIILATDRTGKPCPIWMPYIRGLDILRLYLKDRTTLDACTLYGLR